MVPKPQPMTKGTDMGKHGNHAGRGGRQSKMARRKGRSHKMCPRYTDGPRKGCKKHPRPKIGPLPAWAAPAKTSAAPRKTTASSGHQPPATMNVLRNLPHAFYSDQECPFCHHYPNEGQEIVIEGRPVKTIQCAKCQAWFQPYKAK